MTTRVKCSRGLLLPVACGYREHPFATAILQYENVTSGPSHFSVYNFKNWEDRVTSPDIKDVPCKSWCQSDV